MKTKIDELIKEVEKNLRNVKMCVGLNEESVSLDDMLADSAIEKLMSVFNIALKKREQIHDKQMKSVLSDREREIAEKDNELKIAREEIRKLVADQNEIQLTSREGAFKLLIDYFNNPNAAYVRVDKRLFDALKNHDEIIKADLIKEIEQKSFLRPIRMIIEPYWKKIKGTKK